MSINPMSISPTNPADGETAVLYQGQYPVSSTWFFHNKVGSRVRFVFNATLDELVTMKGTEGMQAFTEETLGLQALRYREPSARSVYTLRDPVYSVIHVHPDNKTLVLQLDMTVHKHRRTDMEITIDEARARVLKDFPSRPLAQCDTDAIRKAGA